MSTKHDHHHHCNHHHGSDQHHGIQSHLHEDALVCSGSRDLIGDPKTIKEKLVSKIGILADWIEETGGIIGHIKALVEVDSPVTVISTTGEAVSVREMTASDIHVSLVAIVFNSSTNALECRIVSLLDDLQKQTENKGVKK